MPGQEVYIIRFTARSAVSSPKFFLGRGLVRGNRVQIVVDGMTGVGKTTLVHMLAEELDLVPFEEIFKDENNLLHKFFYERERWCFPMQINFLVHRFRQYKEASRLNSAVMDRSIFSDPIFARMYREVGYMTQEEYNVYENLLENLLEHLELPYLVVYLRVEAKEAIRRIRKRGRPDELGVEDAYWRRLHRFYEENYRSYPGELLIIDANDLDFVKYREHRRKIIQAVRDKWETLTGGTR